MIELPSPLVITEAASRAHDVRADAARALRVLHVTGGRVFGGIESYLATLASTAHGVPDFVQSFALAFPGELADRLDRAGADVSVFGDDDLRASRPAKVLAARRALARTLERTRLDVALVHGPWAYGVVGGVLRRRLPVVLMAHGLVRGRRWPDAWVRVRPPRGIVANSGWTAAQARAGWPGLPTRVVPLAVEPPAPTTAARSATRRELGAGPNDVVVAIVSRIEAAKGHEELLHALAMLGVRATWQAWIVGGAQSDAERASLARLQTLAGALGIAERVRFLGQRSDVRALLAAADVYCQPNRTPESFGVAIIEALYAGLPIVTSGLGGPAELVTEACGVLVPPCDHAALSAALEPLLVDPERRRRMAAAAPVRAAAISEPVACTRALRTAVAELAGLPC